MTERHPFRSERLALASVFFTGLTGLATWLILAILAVIIGNILWQGLPYVSWRFVTGGTAKDMFDMDQAGVLPLIIGTTAKVVLMTLFVMPVGVVTAVYLTEYARTTSLLTRFMRGAISNLAGVPSIVFGLFGMGFFVYFVGGQLDALLHPDDPAPVWGRPAILWASLTLAVMTLPVVIVTTEESLRALPQGLREASLALGASKLQTIVRIVLPQALPGILTGAILSVGRAAGEVAPILMTGAAYYLASLPKSLTDQFMDLAYHVYILSTQSVNIERTKPLLCATVVVLLFLTFALNIVAVLIRARMRKKMQLLH
ncbi:MAG: phosphate ABC transporter permease PstA [Verrucomicrobiales bacterium]|nr:phosphate ABC transporter permease PstA [Verrucomicrobiales bacterium]